ncbi:MAG: PCRF domain-containing protein, partial [Chloroflexota bacterium]
MAGQQTELAALEEQSAQPDFWNNPDSAQRAMRQAARLRRSVKTWLDTHQRVRDALELAELEDESMAEELAAEADALQIIVDGLLFRAKLSGKYDAEDAYLAIHAGAGGTDAQDWAEMLLRMY